MRRDTIYPHRSIRSLEFTPERILAAILVAVVLTFAMYVGRDRLFVEHNRITATLLDLSGIPISGTARIDIFPVLGSADGAVTNIFHYQSSPLRVAILLISSIIALLIVHRRVHLARNFIVFLFILLLLAAGIMVFFQSFELQSAEFTQIWLREEVLVWFILPWFSASLFILARPDAWAGILWALGVQIFGIVWSAVRLAFCLALIHYSGLLFVPLLWFTFGLLADNIYLLVFFSISTHQAAGKAWGKRLSWQF
jgi:hypothetical protein